jgi:hypothetical protein
MMHIPWLLPIIAPSVARWQESGENPVIFCYLMSWGTYINLRSRTAAATQSL